MNQHREATIFRVVKNKDNPFVMIDRRPIENAKLSYKAKGILSYLLSRPDGWEVNVPDLVNHSTDGPAAVRSGLKELRAAGHVHYNTQREGGYIKKWVVEVYELPKAPYMGDDGEEVLDSDFLQVGNQQVENQQVENRREVIMNLSNKDSSKKSTTTGAEQTQNSFKVYEQNIGALTPMIADQIRDLEDEYGPEWFGQAVQEAVLNEARNLKYVTAILKRWKVEGFQSRKQQKPARTPAPSTTNVPRGAVVAEEWLRKRQEQEAVNG